MSHTFDFTDSVTKPNPNTMRRFNAIKPADGGVAVLEPPAPTAAAVVQAPVISPPPAAPKGLKKISFGGVAKKEEKSGTDYPVFNDPATGAQVLEIAARIKKRSGEIEALEGAQKTDKAELKMFVAPFYFRVNAGKAEPPSSISIPSAEGEVLVTYQNRYSKLKDESPIIPILGERTEKYFRQTFTLKIAGEELPAGQEQKIVDSIIAVLALHGATNALEVDEQVKPTKDFHIARLRDFTPEVNLQLDEACPMITMVKIKGRGAK